MWLIVLYFQVSNRRGGVEQYGGLEKSEDFNIREGGLAFKFLFSFLF